MAANLTPQYLKAEEEYRRAATVEEEVKWLEVMLREIPKHKASEKMQAELKQKLSKAKKEAEVERKSGKKSHGVRIPRQGAGTAILLGGPNSGKSQLLRSLTRATPEVAPYPFTTRAPQPGMMPWEDVYVQLIDTPPITPDFLEPYMQGLIRGADLAVLLVDLGDDAGIEQTQELLDKLNETKTRLAGQSYLDEDDLGLSYTRTLLAPNKIDLSDAALRLELFHELCPLDWPEYVISAEHGTGLEDLRRAIYESLDVVRVYSKLPTHKDPDYEKPYTLRRGGTVLDMAEMVHRDFVENFKHARVWGPSVHGGSTVKGDHVLEDKDIVELHV
ncbi:MAG: 50S ribosome-binding GTPase [Pirellulales bacterium]|nr:50S ribosome-binding GTPase [Pirellulales bacterium]